MKIASIALELPSRKISNKDIISLLEHYNKDLETDTLRKYQREISTLLTRTGADTRYFRDLEKGETAIELTRKAVERALNEAEINADDVDALIFCGVGRGFLEPANAYFVARLFGMTCNCFDVIDACMSWVKALEIASLYLNKPDYRNVLIVNAEFSVYEHGFPAALKLESREKIAYTFPAYTIGEASTATVLQSSEAIWNFSYLSEPAAAPLCTIPLTGYEQFSGREDKIGKNGPGQFVSFGSELFEQTKKSMTKLIGNSGINLARSDIFFPHGAAGNPIIEITSSFKVSPDKVFNKGFAKYGNLVSASIPAAMTLASESGALERGMQCLLCPASAGMSFGLVEFTY